MNSFCSFSFLSLQGQPELCGSYHLFQSCFSFFVRLHGRHEPFGVATIFSSLALLFFLHPLHSQPQPFGSCIILQSCSSFFFRLHGQPELRPLSPVLVFSPTHFHHLVQSFESGQALFLFLTTFCFPLVVFSRFFFSFLFYLFRVVLSSASLSYVKSKSNSNPFLLFFLPQSPGSTLAVW